ncbi:MAG: AtpZ/AtpI family protein [candidate division Zixibacteria bacterium]|nr:AtpZ/AtpI family protein [candidate division Zixibacteria bacterium]
MSVLKPDPKDSSRRDIRQIGLYAAVPGLLLAGPLIGYGIGWWFDGKFDTSPYLAALGVLLGIAAAGIEIFELVKKASSSEDEDDDDTESRT